jgi:Holliday junction DNA helicase RuvA
MISLLRGNVRHKTPLTIVLDVSGVGYEIFCTQEAYDLAPSNGECELWTRLIVREDSMTLFGFASVAERMLFDQIIGVSGIGPKTAIGILSGIGANPLRDAIASGDTGRLTGIPGIGKKTAERLIVELRDKILKEEFSGVAVGDASSAGKARNDALQALMSLGYQRATAEKAIRDVLKEEAAAGQSVESLIKAALKQAAKN